MKLGVVVAWKGTDLLGDASRLHQAFRRQEVEAELNRGLKVLAPRGGGGGGISSRRTNQEWVSTDILREKHRAHIKRMLL